MRRADEFQLTMKPYPLLLLLVGACSLHTVSSVPPLPSARQLAFMERDFVQFMHFGIDTAWQPPESFLRGLNPTYHNCEEQVTGVSRDYQTEGTWPCLNGSIFNPDALDTEQWMEVATSLGVKEVRLSLVSFWYLARTPIV